MKGKAAQKLKGDSLDGVISSLNMACGKLETVKDVLMPMAKAANQEYVLDRIMVLLSEEVIDRTLERLHPEARTSAARLLLKRADQRRVDRRLKMLEEERKNATPVETETGLTAEEKEHAIDQILGIA
jgi:hypothetical protein